MCAACSKQNQVDVQVWLLNQPCLQSNVDSQLLPCTLWPCMQMVRGTPGGETTQKTCMNGQVSIVLGMTQCHTYYMGMTQCKNGYRSDTRALMLTLLPGYKQHGASQVNPSVPLGELL